MPIRGEPGWVIWNREPFGYIGKLFPAVHVGRRMPFFRSMWLWYKTGRKK
jgi:hypothetical protein